MKLYLWFNDINNMWFLSNGRTQHTCEEKVYFRSGHTYLFSSYPSYFRNKLDAVLAAKKMGFDNVAEVAV